MGSGSVSEGLRDDPLYKYTVTLLYFSYIYTLPDITQKPKDGIYELKQSLIDT